MKKSPLNSVLVPTDFSSASREAFQWALRSVDAHDSVIILLHVLDESIIETIVAHEFATREQITKGMRQRAEQQLAEYKSSSASSEEKVTIDTMVVEGTPFLEIIQKAEDFAVDAVIMGLVGMRGHVERLLFGSTIDKVLRGVRRPVVVLPEVEHD